MAMTLEQISQLETAKKTGQPQDMAAMLALLMGGQNPLAPSSSSNIGSDVGVGGVNVGTPLGTTPGGLGTGQDFQTSALVGLLNEAIGGGGDVPGPVSAPGPGPNTAQDIAQAIVDAISQGKDPSQVANDLIAQNQQDITMSQNLQTVLGILGNPVGGALQAGGRALGGNLGGTAGKVAGAALGAMGYAPATPAAPATTIANLVLGLLAGNTQRQNTQVTARGADPNTVSFLEANIPNAAPQGLPSGVPGGTTGGDSSVGVPGVGGMPDSSAVGPSPAGPASVGTPAPADPTEGMATPSFADPVGFTGGELSIGLSPAGQQGEGVGPENPSGEGSTGGSGDGGGAGGSLLANFATGNKPPKQLKVFYDKFMAAHPRDGKKLFTAYQTVAKQVIARAKSKKEEEQLADSVYDEFIDPISKYVDDDEIGLATDTLVRTTKNLARKYNVPIPDRYDNVLKRNGGG